MVELETINATGDDGMTHSLLMTLVHEVPNVDPAVIAANDDDSGSERTESSTGDHTVLVIGRLENWH